LFSSESTKYIFTKTNNQQVKQASLKEATEAMKAEQMVEKEMARQLILNKTA